MASGGRRRTSCWPGRQRSPPTTRCGRGCQQLPSYARMSTARTRSRLGGTTSSTSTPCSADDLAQLMRVGLDATPLLGTRTGVGRYTLSLLTALAAEDNGDLVATAFTFRGRDGLGPVVPP